MANIIAKINANMINIAADFCANKTSSHYNTTRGVYIEPHESGNGVIIAGMDGAYFIFLFDKEGFAKDKFFIDLDKKNISLCKDTSKNQTDNKILTVFDDDSIIISKKDEKIGIQDKALYRLEINWKPIVSSVLAENNITDKDCLRFDGENTNYISVNGWYFGKFSDAANRLTGTPRIAIFTKASRRMLIKFNECDYAFGVLMPMLSKPKTDNSIPTFLSLN